MPKTYAMVPPISRGLHRVDDLLPNSVRTSSRPWAATRALETVGGDPRATTPAEMRARVASQLATWIRLAKEANISIGDG
jgi:hypothetical protein